MHSTFEHSERNVAPCDLTVRMSFSVTASGSPRRFAGRLLSLLSFFFCTAFLMAAALTAERPLAYLHGGLWVTALVSVLVNAVLQLLLAFSDRDLGTALSEGRASSPFVQRLAALLATLATLSFAGGNAVLAVRAAEAKRIAANAAEMRDSTGMCVTAVLAGALFLVGAVGLLLECFADGRYPTPQTLLRLALPLASVTFSLYLYFDKSVPRNASLKLLVSLSFLLLALLWLLRLREAVGNPRPRLAVYLTRAATPLIGALGCALLLLGIVKKAVFVSPTVGICLIFLSFYFYMVFSAPAGGIKGHRDCSDDCSDGAYIASDADEEEDEEEA